MDAGTASSVVLELEGTTCASCAARIEQRPIVAAPGSEALR